MDGLVGEDGGLAAGGELSGGRRTRRSWTIDEKLAIVNEAKTCGDPIALVARRHGMNANHLFNWMQRERDGTLDRRALYAAPGGPMDFIDLGVVGHGGRSARGSTIVTSQVPADQWHEVIGDPTLADAILDRLVHNAHRLNMTGESMRRITARRALDEDHNP